MRSRRPIPDFFRYGHRPEASDDDSEAQKRGGSSVGEENISHVLMPPNDVILREFEEYLEILGPVSEEEEDKLRKLSIEKKWKLVFNQDTHVGFHPAKKYVDNLRLYVESGRRDSGSLRKSYINVSAGCSNWLRKLKVDLKRLPDSFVEEFIEKPNNGISLLLGVLRQILADQERLQLIRKSSSETLKNSLLDQLDCLICIKLALKSKKSISTLLACNGAVTDITLCLISNFRKISLVVMEILTLVCNERTGYLHVTDAITTLRMKNMETVRFKLIISMLHGPAGPHFQAVCVRFFNKLLACTDDANAKVYLQYELEQAGFDPDLLDRYSLGQSVEFSELQKELDIWRKNYINVDRDREELYQQQNRNSMLRDEIDRLQAKLKEAESNTEKEKKLRQNAEARFDKLRENAAEMQDVLGRISKVCKEHIGIDLTKEIPDFERFYKPLEGYATVKDRFGTLSGNKSQSVSSLDQVMSPPPAPPIMPPSYMSNTIRRKVDSHVNLPMLNWTPMYSVRNTLFEDIDDEAKLHDIDFTEFDRIFQLPLKEVESRDRGDRIIQRSANLITCVETSKARNMIITIKRTGLSHKELRTAIDSFQLNKLPGEYAELLLKYVPTKDELKCLAKHAKQYDRLGEAEKYLVQMTKVERLERKLSLMAFIGKFDDVINNIKPEMELIQRASEMLRNSIKLKKVFELILAFGNYMNSMKKGYAVGFRLESLSKLQEVKSGDKSQTLLHYLAHFIENRYPELLNFGDELDLSLDRGVSYQSVASDVLGLRRGMDLLRSEMEKHPENEILTNFHSVASPQVMETADRFRKMEEEYKTVCAYFGEDYRQKEPDELVKYITDFVVGFKRALEENHRSTQTETQQRQGTQRRQESVSSYKETKPLQERTVLKRNKGKSATFVSRTYVCHDGVSNGRVADSRRQPHVTVIDVSKDQNFGVSRTMSLTKSTEHLTETRRTSAAKTADIRLSKSNSFIYANDKQYVYTQIKKSPSMNGNSDQSPRPPEVIGEERQDANQQVPVDPVYEDIREEEDATDKMATTTSAGDSQKSHGSSDSIATNSLSSMSTTATNTSDSTGVVRVYPVTPVVNGNSDPKPSEDKDRRMSTASIIYNRQLNEVINNLDKILDEESADSVVAAEDAITYL